MDISQFLDSTYLKTPEQAGLSDAENLKLVRNTISESIEYKFKLVMIRPDMVSIARQMITEAHSKVLVGTVIDFPNGNGSIEAKLAEAQQAIDNGADDLDFVVNFEAFKAGDTAVVKQQVEQCSRLGLEAGKTVKWIIEIAALNDHQIVQLTALIKNIILSHFEESDYSSVYVKSSTGFYRTEDGVSNGATIPAIKLMLENSFPLPVKAAGGVRNFEEVVQMIELGVKRIGTSAAKAIVSGQIASGSY